MAYTYTSKILTNSKHDTTRTEVLAKEFSLNFIENTLISEIEKASKGWLTYEEKKEDTTKNYIYYRFKIKGEELYDLVWRVRNSWNTSGWSFNGQDIWALHLRSDTTLSQEISWANTATNSSINVNTTKVIGSDKDGYDYTIEYRLDFITDDEVFAIVPMNNSHTSRSSFLIYAEHNVIFNGSASSSGTRAFNIENITVETTTELNAYSYDVAEHVVLSYPRFADGNKRIKYIAKKVANIYNNTFGTNNSNFGGSGSGIRISIVKEDGTIEAYMQVLGMWWLKE